MHDKIHSYDLSICIPISARSTLVCLQIYTYTLFAHMWTCFVAFSARLHMPWLIVSGHRHYVAAVANSFVGLILRRRDVLSVSDARIQYVYMFVVVSFSILIYTIFIANIGQSTHRPLNVRSLDAVGVVFAWSQVITVRHLPLFCVLVRYLMYFV